MACKLRPTTIAEYPPQKLFRTASDAEWKAKANYLSFPSNLLAIAIHQTRLSNLRRVANKSKTGAINQL